jgi:hypothetical protein
MARKTISELCDESFLTQQQRATIIKLIEKKSTDSPAFSKLLTIHDLMTDAVLSDPIKTIQRFVMTAQQSMSNIQEYMNEDITEEVYTGKSDKDEQPIFNSVHRKYAVLIDKTNGIPERMSSLQKLISDASMDLLVLITTHRKHASEDSQKEIEEATGMSYADINSGRNRR